MNSTARHLDPRKNDRAPASENGEAALGAILTSGAFASPALAEEACFAPWVDVGARAGDAVDARTRVASGVPPLAFTLCAVQHRPQRHSACQLPSAC